MDKSYTVSVLLDYIANRFLFVYAICLMGALARECADSIRNLTKINLTKNIVSTLLISILICAIIDIYTISASIIIAICFFSGMWSTKISERLKDWSFVKKFALALLKTFKKEVGNALEETLKEDDKENTNNDKKES